MCQPHRQLPGVLVSPLFFDVEDGMLCQIAERDAGDEEGCREAAAACAAWQTGACTMYTTRLHPKTAKRVGSVNRAKSTRPASEPSVATHVAAVLADAVSGPLLYTARRSVDREPQRVRSCLDALYRIAAGTYGVCVSCQQAIEPVWLRLRPDAVECLGCHREGAQRSSLRTGTHMLRGADAEGKQLDGLKQTDS